MSLTRAQLPVRLTPLVGRETELGDIVGALDRSRLITLTGPGGAGKTRLALAAAKTAGQSFPAGVHWVALAQIDDPSIVGQAIATQLSVPDTPGQDAAEAVAEQIADHRTLLVLDNCEHLAEAAASVAEYLLASCPALVVLASSREALGVEGELSWQVPPLSLPKAEPAPTAATLARSDAVMLFEQRAQLVRPSFRVTDENAAAVLTICRRLDGLPLAIELAAARMRIMSAAQLAERLDDIFALLVGGARSAPPRHQALRATLDWSHDLLDSDERAIFRRLAVFFGGFTLRAAERIAAAGEIGPDAMLELLTRLADKSLLRVEHARGDSRYFLLAIIRDYARDKLEAASESVPVRRAHLQYFTGLVERAAASIEQVEGKAGRLELELDRLDAELPNLRRAVEFALESGDAVAALMITGPLDRYAYLRGLYHEIRQWMDAAVTSGPDAPAGLRAKALLGGGRLALLQCDYAAAVRRLEAALRLYRELADPRGIASGLQVLGSVAREQGRYARAVQLHAESLAIAEAAGDRWAAASARSYLAFASWLQRDFTPAIEQASTALAIFRDLGDVEGVAWSLINLGTAARYRGDGERASALLTESLSLSEGIGFQEGIAWSAEQLGLLAAVDGDPAAVPLLRRSLELHRELRDRWRMSSVLEDLSALALAQGNALQAARLLGAEFGDAALTAADWSYAKPRELMFLLACSPPMTKDQIAAALRPDLSRQQLGNALHTALRELRRALGDPGWVLYTDGRYRFDRSRPHECDATSFEDALAAARRARPSEAALPELQRAIAAYGGDFLDGMATGEWALVRRDELRRVFESALLATGRLQAAAGRHQAAAVAFRRAVAHEPLNESAHRELMSCWARLGETARAIRHYEELAEALRGQVGVPPAAETTALYRRLMDAR